MSRTFLAVAVALALAGTARAQVRQLQLDRPLDANPQVGVGRSNQPVPPGFVPINGNDIATGNVTGLAYFHAPIYTVNPYDFRGNLGSATLFNFARQSAGAPLNGGTYTGITQPYYLPSSTVSTGQGALYSAPMGSGFDSALIPRYSYSPAMNAAQVRSITGAVSTEAVNRAMSTEPLTPGTPGNVIASPLFVLRTTELPGKTPDMGVTTTAPARIPGLRLPGSETGGENKAGMGNEPPLDEEQPLENPNQVQGAVGGGHDQRIIARTDELRNARISDTYRKLAEELRLTPGQQPTGAENKEPAGAAGTAGTVAKGPDIDPFTGQPRRITPLGATTLPALNAGGPTTGPATQPGRGAQTRPASGLSAQGLVAMSDNELRSGATHKPVSLTPELQPGTSVSGFEMLMTRAGKELSGGKFMEAAESYQGALSIKPDDLLALIGRANAEFASGIYSGADFDLKFAFTRNPKMISVIYSPGSFIPANRQTYLLDDLQKLVAKKDTSNMASFLYCYLCYETGRKDLLDAELQKWGKREGHDEWQTVAQRAWGTK